MFGEKKQAVALNQYILFYRNGLAIWHGFPDIRILKSIIASSRTFWLLPSSNCSGHIPPWSLFYSNGLALWQGFLDITHILKSIAVARRPFLICSSLSF